MPYALKGPCKVRPCPNLSDYRGYCFKHAKLEEQQDNESKAFYHTPFWQGLRRAQLLREPTCITCGEVASVADHIVPRNQGGADDLDNLQSLCQLHHNMKRSRESRTRAR